MKFWTQENPQLSFISHYVQLLNYLAHALQTTKIMYRLQFFVIVHRHLGVHVFKMERLKQHTPE